MLEPFAEQRDISHLSIRKVFFHFAWFDAKRHQIPIVWFYLDAIFGIARFFVFLISWNPISIFCSVGFKQSCVWPN